MSKSPTNETGQAESQWTGQHATASHHHTASEETMLANRVTIRRQGREILEQIDGKRGNAPRVTCQCGKRPSTLMAYRCLYCGVWFCKECATEHFDAQEKT